MGTSFMKLTEDTTEVGSVVCCRSKLLDIASEQYEAVEGLLLAGFRRNRCDVLGERKEFARGPSL